MRHVIITIAILVFQAGYVLAQSDSVTVYSTSTSETQSNSFPQEVFGLTNLRHLTVVGMDCDYRELDEKGNDITKCWGLREIPKEIGNLKDLETLSLTLNYIEKLPEEIRQLKKMRVLDMTDNPGLSNVESIIDLENLEELILFGCNLTFLPKK
jgi:Leucine-rich repeat (LRR) protein